MFQKIVKDGYINSVVDGVSIGNITEAEYSHICETIQNKPTAEDRFDYRLKEDLTWEKCEIVLENKDGE